MLCKSLCEAVQQTPSGEVLESIDGVESEEFYKFYLHDFVKTVHKCHHKKEDLDATEYKVQQCRESVNNTLGRVLQVVSSYRQQYFLSIDAI